MVPFFNVCFVIAVPGGYCTKNEVGDRTDVPGHLVHPYSAIHMQPFHKKMSNKFHIQREGQVMCEPPGMEIIPSDIICVDDYTVIFGNKSTIKKP